MPNIHPLIVHFPIALLTISFIFDVIGMLTGKKEFTMSAWWMLLIGTISVAAAIASGLSAAGGLESSSQAREHIENHQEAALVVAGVFAFLLLWRVANKTRVPDRRWLYLVLSVVGLVAVWVTALYGGELVYEFGVGVAK
ncbi:MAG: DUF2231 domain-containing protein [Ignavibacteriae bacterium]|nr:DUF2231 domain-containing protein [Ignavibacteriota bacterium]